MSELEISESAVTGVAVELRSVVDETRSGLASLDTSLNRLLGSNWTGQAGSAFGEMWTRWQGGAEDVVKGLEAMASALEQAAGSYGATDTEGGAAVGSAGM